MLTLERRRMRPADLGELAGRWESHPIGPDIVHYPFRFSATCSPRTGVSDTRTARLTPVTCVSRLHPAQYVVVKNRAAWDRLSPVPRLVIPSLADRLALVNSDPSGPCGPLLSVRRE